MGWRDGNEESNSDAIKYLFFKKWGLVCQSLIDISFKLKNGYGWENIQNPYSLLMSVSFILILAVLKHTDFLQRNTSQTNALLANKLHSFIVRTRTYSIFEIQDKHIQV